MSTSKNNDQMNEEAFANNNRTLQSYEACALSYAASAPKYPTAPIKETLEYMVQIAGKGGTVLEVGSGPGWEADFVESLGVNVRRTDATAAFRDFQAQRGKKIESLNIITDDFGGVYDAVVALYVLQHIDRNHVAPIIHKVADALRPEGCFLVCILEGENELWEHGDASGDYHIVFWSEADFVDTLNAAGLKVILTTRHIDNEGPWMTFVAQKKN